MDFLSRRMLVPYLMLSKDNIYQYPCDDDHTAYDKGRGKGFSEESYTIKTYRQGLYLTSVYSP